MKAALALLALAACGGTLWPSIEAATAAVYHLSVLVPAAMT